MSSTTKLSIAFHFKVAGEQKSSEPSSKSHDAERSKNKPFSLLRRQRQRQYILSNRTKLTEATTVCTKALSSSHDDDNASDNYDKPNYDVVLIENLKEGMNFVPSLPFPSLSHTSSSSASSSSSVKTSSSLQLEEQPKTVKMMRRIFLIRRLSSSTRSLLPRHWQSQVKRRQEHYVARRWLVEKQHEFQQFMIAIDQVMMMQQELFHWLRVQILFPCYHFAISGPLQQDGSSGTWYHHYCQAFQLATSKMAVIAMLALVLRLPILLNGISWLALCHMIHFGRMWYLFHIYNPTNEAGYRGYASYRNVLLSRGYKFMHKSISIRVERG